MHGLGGHPYNTWTYKNNSVQTPKTSRLKSWKLFKRQNQNDHVPEPSPAQEVFWPVHLLLQSESCTSCRVLTWGHSSSVVTPGQAVNQDTIFQHGMNLFYDLKRFREKNELEGKVNAQNLVFVAHSLGGIIVKEVRIFTYTNQYLYVMTKLQIRHWPTPHLVFPTKIMI